MGQSKSSVILLEVENCLFYIVFVDISKFRLFFKFFFKKGKLNLILIFGCKVIFVKKNGKSFIELNQIYISVNEDSVNVVYIIGKV